MFTTQGAPLSFSVYSFYLGFYSVGMLDHITDHVIELNLQSFLSQWSVDWVCKLQLFNHVLSFSGMASLSLETV